jgi:hypothetical protein
MGRVNRLSITITPELDDAMRRAAEQDGESISAWVTRAIEEKLQRHQEDLEVQRRLEELADWFGPAPHDVAEEVDAEMKRLGLTGRDD